MNTQKFAKSISSIFLSLTLLVPTATAQSVVIEPVWEAVGFSEPEAVLYVPGHPWIYVSNPNEPEPGYVSRIAHDGTVDQIKWADGVQRPTGMAFLDGALYVVDVNRLVKFDAESGEISEVFTSEEANSLNDVAIGPDGQFYISDVFSNVVATVEEGSVVTWLQTPELNHPNAMMALEDALCVGGVAIDMQDMGPGKFGGVLCIDYETREFSRIPGTEGLATWDGLIEFNGGYLGSSPATGDVWFVKDGQATSVANLGPGISDFGWDPENQMLYVPHLNENKVIAYRVTATE